MAPNFQTTISNAHSWKKMYFDGFFFFFLWKNIPEGPTNYKGALVQTADAYWRQQAPVC